MKRILLIDKTAGLAASHERHQAMAQMPGVELHVLGPRHWIENGRAVNWTPPADTRYQAHFGRVLFKDYYARHGYYSGLCRALRAGRPDIIQLLEEPWSIAAAQTVTAASMLAPQAKVLFYTWENIYRPWVYPARLSPLYRQIDQRLHRVSAGAVCATRRAQEVLLRKGYAKPTAVISYGIPHFFFEQEPPGNARRQDFTIGFIGRLMHMKGVDILLKAAAQIPPCRLVLVGSGEEEAEFRRQAVELGIDQRVEWLPPTDEREIPERLRRMDVLVLPSRRVDGWQEQLGRVLIEGMAIGVPVIGSSSGAIPEVIGDAGLVFEENSVESLIQRIEQLRRNPEQRRQFAQAGRERAQERFTWQRFAKEICGFYDAIIQR